MSASTECVVDSVKPLRRSPRGVRRDPDAPRLQSSACSQCHSPTTLQFGRPDRRDIGPQVSRRCAAGRSSNPQRPSENFLGGKKEDFSGQVRSCRGWWTHSQQRPLSETWPGSVAVASHLHQHSPPHGLALRILKEYAVQRKAATIRSLLVGQTKDTVCALENVCFC